jgi:hypothetical protein
VADQEQIITGPALAGILNGMIQGDPQLFIIRRGDVVYQSVTIPAMNLVVDVDLNTPRNLTPPATRGWMAHNGNHQKHSHWCC